MKMKSALKFQRAETLLSTLLIVEEPQLWWPRGYGEPSLYDASVKVYSGAELLDDASIKVGIRNIELIQEPDEEGKIFHLQNQRSKRLLQRRKLDTRRLFSPKSQLSTLQSNS